MANVIGGQIKFRSECPPLRLRQIPLLLRTQIKCSEGAQHVRSGAQLRFEESKVGKGKLNGSNNSHVGAKFE
jgi:hypothetical protein